jgi:tetratricopeptide (TPR) repeat protein
MSEETPKQTPSPADIEKAENLLRHAHIARERGDKVKADALLKEAQEAAPDSSMVLEAVGDDLVERRQVPLALAAYKRAVDADPENTALETKYAECVLMAQGIVDPFERPAAGVATYASAKTAIFLSAIVPGLGQMVTGSVKAGVITLGVWLLCLLGILLMPGGFTNISQMHMGALALLSIGALAWLSGIVSLSAKAKTAEPRVIVERPTPPVDKDYEL